MSLLITGGLGFLGQQAARHFLRCGVWSPALRTVVPLRTLTLFDVGLPPPGTLREEITSDDRVRVVTGDLSDKGVPAELIDEEDMSVIHLASMVSGDTEEDPDMGWRTNVEGQRLLLEAIKEKKKAFEGMTEEDKKKHKSAKTAGKGKESKPPVDASNKASLVSVGIFAKGTDKVQVKLDFPPLSAGA